MKQEGRHLVHETRGSSLGSRNKRVVTWFKKQEGRHLVHETKGSSLGS